MAPTCPPAYVADGGFQRPPALDHRPAGPTGAERWSRTSRRDGLFLTVWASTVRVASARSRFLLGEMTSRRVVHEGRRNTSAPPATLSRSSADPCVARTRGEQTLYAQCLGSCPSPPELVGLLSHKWSIARDETAGPQRSRANEPVRSAAGRRDRTRTPHRAADRRLRPERDGFDAIRGVRGRGAA